MGAGAEIYGQKAEASEVGMCTSGEHFEREMWWPLIGYLAGIRVDRGKQNRENKLRGILVV